MVDAAERSRLWRLANPERFSRAVRNATLRKKYGITIEDYEKMFDDQGGACAICGRKEFVKDRTGRVRENLSVDHDHGTNRIRGLLCHHCNAALGHVSDDPSLLVRMVNYLEETI